MYGEGNLRVCVWGGASKGEGNLRVCVWGGESKGMDIYMGRGI